MSQIDNLPPGSVPVQQKDGFTVYQDPKGNTFVVQDATGETPRGYQWDGQRNDLTHKPVKDVALDTLDPGNLLHAEKPDLSGLQQAQDTAFGFGKSLGDERANFVGNYNPQNEQDIRARQTGALDMLGAAAAGTTPSVAELQLRQQAARNAAGAYGTAAALQGRSPGTALRSAQNAGVAVQGQTNADAAILRAKEMSDARNQYIQGLSGVRTGDQNLLGYDTDWRKTLLGAQGEAVGQGVGAAQALGQANTTAAGANNIFKGGIIQTAGNVYGGGKK